MLNCTGVEQLIIYRRVHMANNVSRILLYKGRELIAFDYAYVKLKRTRTEHEQQ